MTPNERNATGTGEGAERDPRLDRAYRAGTREEPPAHLDAAILAAARREVGARPRAASARLRAWRVPVSIAAVVVLSVSLVTLVREEGGGRLDQSAPQDLYSQRLETAPVPAAPAPDVSKAPARAKPQTAAPAARDDAATEATASAKTTEDTRRRAAAGSTARSAVREPQAPSPAVAPSPRPFQDAPAARGQQPLLSADQVTGAGMERQSSGFRAGGGESLPPPAESAAAAGPAARMAERDRAASREAVGSIGTAQPPAPAAKLAPKAEARALRVEPAKSDTDRVAALIKDFAPQPAEKWVEKIESLRREGRRAEADDLLAEFKRRFPDYPLPPALR